MTLHDKVREGRSFSAAPSAMQPCSATVPRQQRIAWPTLPTDPRTNKKEKQTQFLRVRYFAYSPQREFAVPSQHGKFLATS
jgi:hypothetical protein